MGVDLVLKKMPSLQKKRVELTQKHMRNLLAQQFFNDGAFRNLLL